MPRVYAVSAQLPALRRQDAIEVFSLALREWMGNRWPEASEWFNPSRPGGVSSAAGRFRWEPVVTKRGLLVDFTWTHRDARNEAIHWTTTATLHSLSGDAIRFDLEVSNDGPDIDEPGTLLTTGSRLPLVLSELTPVQWGTGRVRQTARFLSADAVQDFVRYELLDASRSVPVTILAPLESGSFLVAPEALARVFGSVCEVVALESPAASWELTRTLGSKQLSCFHGALRTYMPGLRVASDPFGHPLLTSARVAQPPARLRLAQTLALRAAETYRSSALLAEARAERAIDFANRTAALLASRKESQSEANDATIDAALAELAERESQLVEENALLRKENDRLLRQSLVLRAEVRRMRVSGDAEAVEAAVFAPESVLEAVENASHTYGDALVLLPSAFSAAEASLFRKPLDVQRLLFALGDIAGAAVDGAIGKDLYAALRDRGFTYKSDVGDATSRKLLAQYSATYDGDEYACTEHVRLGTTYDPEDCLVVYFASDLKKSRFIIKSVGKHFQNMTST